MNAIRQISETTARARAFLTQRVLENRYHLSGTSNLGKACPVDGMGQVFTAFFIVQALQPVGLDDRVRQTVLKRIHDEESDGLWGFGKHAVVDSDDSAFALRTLDLLEQPVRWLPLLGFHAPSAGWFRTFRSTRACQLVTSASEANNRAAHPEVNANIFRLLQAHGGESFVNTEGLLACQSADGSWPAYYYPNDYYGTLFAIPCLRPLRGAREALERAGRFLIRSQNHDGAWSGAHAASDPYLTGLAMNALLELGEIDSEAYDRGIGWLLEQQQADGSWHSEAIIYRHVVDDHTGEAWIAKDVTGVLTTSLALRAIHARESPMTSNHADG
jgi:hypothetical protein